MSIFPQIDQSEKIDFSVSWTFDIEADTPQSGAELVAHIIKNDPSVMIFTLTDKNSGLCYEVNLYDNTCIII